jgi:hypothetical protein
MLSPLRGFSSNIGIAPAVISAKPQKALAMYPLRLSGANESGAARFRPIPT